MEVQLFTCAESISVDAHSNRLSLFHIFEEMRAVSFPAVVPQLSVVAALQKASEAEPDPTPSDNYSIRASLGDAVLFEFPIQFLFNGLLRARAIATVQGVFVPSPGVLQFSLSKNGNELANWKTWVTAAGPEVQPIQLPLPG